MRFTNEFIVKPGAKLTLADHDPDFTMGYESKRHVDELLEKNTQRLAELQYLLYAENRRALLVVLQALDASGKDGTIRHVMSGLNPQSCRVRAFKQPSSEELAHDFLWRVHQAVPAKGEIGIFNRSHYEDVLVVRVRNLVPRAVWSARFKQIVAFEEILKDSSITILKFFLHISRDEQKKRLEARIEDPTKNWKISPTDFEDRALWSQYMKAYEDVLSRCSRKWAPWFIIPSNKKWFRNLAVSHIITEALAAMDMKFPPAAYDLSKLKVE